MTPASENLLTTYLAIGLALPGAEIREAEGYVALLSDLAHPSGNFAVRLGLDPWSAGELRELALARPAFQAVALPDDEPFHLAELLRRAGFEAVQRLVTMEATPAFGLSGLETARCGEIEARREAGRFMTDAFFARETVMLRHAMAEALAFSPLDLRTVVLREKIVAAFAFSRTEGVLGIYNLCVAGLHRGKGIGGSTVAWCLAQAAAEGRTACLQCAPSLEGWYEGHGFRRTGTITVWSL